VFLFFVLFAIFGAANVVTGIFVEIANHWAQNDSHAQIQADSEQKAFVIRALHELFGELDAGGHGTLTLEGMQEAIASGDERLVSSFHALELEIMDVRTLFLLLDRDRKGYVSTEEFLLGCFRLKGEARTLDIMKLQYQCEWIMHNVLSINDNVDDIGANMSKVLSSLDASALQAELVESNESGPNATTAATGPSPCFYRNLSAHLTSQHWEEVLRQGRPQGASASISGDECDTPPSTISPERRRRPPVPVALSARA
jgi:hypothetical protein